VLGVLSAALALATSQIGALIGEPPWWLEVPSVISWYGLLWVLFDRWLWDSKAARIAGLVAVPNLSGRWTASLTSSHDSHVKNYRGELVITQTWNRISISLKTADSRSVSTAASIVTNGADAMLMYHYVNTPRTGTVASMEAHSGTVELHWSPGAVRLEGSYFSGRGRQTIGHMTLVPTVDI
jgi:hypothetical protein